MNCLSITYRIRLRFERWTLYYMTEKFSSFWLFQYFWFLSDSLEMSDVLLPLCTVDLHYTVGPNLGTCLSTAISFLSIFRTSNQVSLHGYS